MYNLSDTLMGCLGGLVSITASCAYVQSWASIVIGIVSGILYLFGTRLMIRFGIDDAVDAVRDSHDMHSFILHSLKEDCTS
jgi:Amt family ammonium transporter